MIKAKVLILAASAALALSALGGCQYLTSPAAQPFDAVAVAVAVDAVVGTDTLTQAAKAAAVKKIASEVLAADTGAVTTVASLEALAGTKIALLKLPPGEEAAVNLVLAVLDTAVNQYLAKLGGSSNAANAQVAVAAVCKWVIAEATRLGG